MGVLWCGQEDIDFPNGTGGASIVDQATASGGGTGRTGWTRTELRSSSFAHAVCSKPFPGGAITSGWFTFRTNPSNPETNQLLAGLVSSSASYLKGLWVGFSSSSSTKLALFTFDDTTKTQLAAESGNSGPLTASTQIAVNIASFGATATITVYVAGVLIITFTGDVTLSSSISSVDSFAVMETPTGGSTVGGISECIVSTDDVRAYLGLQTLALTGAGTLQDWSSPTYTNINGTKISDSTPTFSNTNNQEVEYNITDPASAGSYSVAAVKIAARAALSSTPAVTKLELGYDSGGTDGFGTGATKTLTPIYDTYEQLDTVNPVTAVAFVQSEMNALQLNMTAKT